MTRPTHIPHPPTDRLAGRWIIERAEVGEDVEISGKPGHVWAITVRHVETDTTEHVTIATLATTRLAVGREIEGRIERRWSGLWFRRTPPAIDRAGR